MRTPLIIAVSFALFFTSLSCDESLPPRDEPQQVLQVNAFMVTGTVIFRGGIADGLQGSLVASAKNLYSEVLQGGERIHADVDVWLRDMPDQRAFVQATKGNLTNPGLVYGNLLTLGPDTTLTLLKRWDHQTNGGTPFWEFVHLTPKVTSRGEAYLESDPVHFVATARIQVFENVQEVEVGPFEFTLVYDIF